MTTNCRLGFPKLQLQYEALIRFSNAFVDNRVRFFFCLKVATNDLTADGDDDLAGYWGGFSGDVDGTALGFLSPFFNGNNFHGKAVQVVCSFVCLCVFFTMNCSSHPCTSSSISARADHSSQVKYMWSQTTTQR